MTHWREWAFASEKPIEAWNPGIAVFDSLLGWVAYLSLLTLS